MALNVIVLVAEALCVWLGNCWRPHYFTGGGISNDHIEALILSVSGYLLGAQVGALTVVSLSLALVTLIAQREESATDVQVYYHVSFSFEIVASCVALIAALCIQLLWPLQFLLQTVGFGADFPIFKLILLGLHLMWLIVNLAAVAYFIATTFRFVQQSSREILRERYTANVVYPRDLTKRLRQHYYLAAANQLLDGGGDKEDRLRPSVYFGLPTIWPSDVELETNFKQPMVLHDVRMSWVRWVLRRWSSRCIAAAAQKPTASLSGLGHQGPSIAFTPLIDLRLAGKVQWCRRRGGVPLKWVEKLVLRRAFRFRSYRDEE